MTEPSLTEENTNKNVLARAVVAACIAAIVAFIVYVPALNNGFVNWDDSKYVYDNPYIRRLDPAFILWAFKSVYFSNWHPLTLISYAVDYKFWNLNPFGYHLTNVILHAADTFLAGLLAAVLAKTSHKGAKAIPLFFFTLTVALLFALHPLRVESVAWVSERKDMLYAFFFILGILAYVRYAYGPSSVIRRPYYFVSILAFALSLMSKPMAVTLPVVLIVLDIYFKRSCGIKRIVFEKLPFFAIGAVVSVVTLFAQHGAREDSVAFATRAATAFKALAFYLYKTALPLKLLPYYPYPALGASVINIENAAALAVFIAISVFCAVTFKRNRLFSAVWLYYVITLLPVLGLIQVGGQAAADRYTYLPGLAPFILIAAGAFYLLERRPVRPTAIVVVALTVIISVALGFLTVRQTAIWKDSVTLWTYEIEKNPRARIAHNNLGLAHAGAGDDARAVADFDAAISLGPGFTEPYVNRGGVLHRHGLYSEAIADYTKAVALDANSVEAHYNRALSLQKLGDYDGAVADYGRAIAIEPSHAEAYIHRGIILRSTGRLPDALKDFDSAVRIDPLNFFAILNRGITRFSAGDAPGAIEDMKKSVEINPGMASAHYYLGFAYSKAGEAAKAIGSMKTAASLGSKEAAEFIAEDKSGDRLP